MIVFSIYITILLLSAHSQNGAYSHSIPHSYCGCYPQIQLEIHFFFNTFLNCFFVLSTLRRQAHIDCKLNRLMLYKIDNIHNERETCYTDSTLPGYSIMSVVCILYVYQDSALNHMMRQDLDNFSNSHLNENSYRLLNKTPLYLQR